MKKSRPGDFSFYLACWSSHEVFDAFNSYVKIFLLSLQRGEYRKFWYDRMNTVRLWKCLFDENEVLINGHLGACIDFRWEGKDFTVRGLENYILSSSEEANRHRDLYHVAVLQDPYDADGMLANVCAMSRASLQWAQSYAVQDAIDPYEASSLTPISDRIGNTFPRLQCGSTPPRSPSSILSINKLHRSMETPHDKKLDITCIREMNKRLIKQHLNDSAYHNLSPVQKKLKRRSSSTGCYTLTHRSNLTYPERRHSAASLSKDLRRQPVSLQMHRIPRIDHQHRQPPSMDLNEHMQFCNRLLNDLPIVDHGPYRRDSLTLANSDSKVFHDQIGSNDLGMEDEFVLQQQIISASLCKSRRALFSGIGNDNFASDTSTVPVSYESFNTTVPYENFSDYGDRSLLRQMLQPVHQKPFSTHDSALLEYTNSVRNYSRLRRDSLGGNFGFF
jgi:hypothetical protein